MSDQNYWKKTNERNDLDYFLAAYEEATEISLAVVAERETPDFVCEGANGKRVGVELTKIIAHPESRLWHRLFGSGAINSTWDIASAISYAAFEKAHKLHNSDLAKSETILVIQLFDNPLSETHRGLEHIDYDEFEEAEFSEIWVSDHSTIDAHGRVELFGIYPEHIAGYYALTFGRKPYG
jgi:hypothetical protein